MFVLLLIVDVLCVRIHQRESEAAKTEPWVLSVRVKSRQATLWYLTICAPTSVESFGAPPKIRFIRTTCLLLQAGCAILFFPTTTIIHTVLTTAISIEYHEGSVTVVQLIIELAISS